MAVHRVCFRLQLCFCLQRLPLLRQMGPESSLTGPLPLCICLKLYQMSCICLNLHSLHLLWSLKKKKSPWIFCDSVILFLDSAARAPTWAVCVWLVVCPSTQKIPWPLIRFMRQVQGSLQKWKSGWFLSFLTFQPFRIGSILQTQSSKRAFICCFSLLESTIIREGSSRIAKKFKSIKTIYFVANDSRPL